MSDLRIGYSSYLNTKLLEVIMRLRPEVSEAVSVTRESLMAHQAVTGVLQGDLHVGFGILPIPEPDLATRLLMEEPLMACLPAGHRLATRNTIRPEDLADEPMIATLRKVLPDRHDDIVTHFESLGVFLKFKSEAFSLKEALWLVTHGVGVALMTRFLAISHRHDVVVRPSSPQTTASCLPMALYYAAPVVSFYSALDTFSLDRKRRAFRGSEFAYSVALSECGLTCSSRCWEMAAEPYANLRILRSEAQGGSDI